MDNEMHNINDLKKRVKELSNFIDKLEKSIKRTVIKEDCTFYNLDYLIKNIPNNEENKYIISFLKKHRDKRYLRGIYNELHFIEASYIHSVIDVDNPFDPGIHLEFIKLYYKDGFSLIWYNIHDNKKIYYELEKDFCKEKYNYFINNNLDLGEYWYIEDLLETIEKGKTEIFGILDNTLIY